MSMIFMEVVGHSRPNASCDRGQVARQVRDWPVLAVVRHRSIAMRASPQGTAQQAARWSDSWQDIAQTRFLPVATAASAPTWNLRH